MYLSNFIKRQSTPNKVIRLWPMRVDFPLRLPLKIRFKEKAITVIGLQVMYKEQVANRG
jgi:hypothetical protein